MATDQLINKTQGDAIISGLTAIKNAINDQPVPTQVEDVVADAFDVGVSYVPGDYCIYENKLYVCDTAHHGAWDGNDFTLTTVGAVLESLNNDLLQYPKGEFIRCQMITPTLDTNYSYDYSSYIRQGAKGVTLVSFGICNSTHSADLEGGMQGASVVCNCYHYSESKTIVFIRRNNVDSRYEYAYAILFVSY